jgi:excinuclease ABC subunit A
VESPLFRRHFPDFEPPTTARQGRVEGLSTNLLRRYAERIHDAEYRDKMDEFLVTQICPDCEGTRLRPESRAVTVNGRNIIALSRLPLTDLGGWLEALPSVLSSDDMLIAEAILVELSERIERLVEVGAGYLTMERSSPTLSAGEAQRLRLASCLARAHRRALRVR